MDDASRGNTKPRSPAVQRRSPHIVQLSPRHGSTKANSVAKPSAVPEISQDEYFRLLRKTDVLGYLLRVNDDLETKEARLESAEIDNAKLATVQKYLVVEHEMLKAKWHEMKRLFTDHLSELTHVCLEEEALRTGHAAAAAKAFAGAQGHARLTNDVHRAAKSLHGHDDESATALAKVGKDRLAQVAAICVAYRKELSRVETLAFEQESKGAAAHSTEHLYTESIESELATVQSEKAQLADRMHLVAKQNEALQAQVASLHEELEAHKRQERLMRATWGDQERSVLQLLTTVKGDIRKRFGFVPPALEHFAFTPQHAPPSSVSMQQ
ncbi:hypothetical protein SPRG_22061 [Saprolegnia parasitica CBS 223.65]|uniref:Uncharacterized protein n=1 Tax=Saprolegnia parasitica (strain CBS 223.65) TaxID=695850 RepID=A0A067CW16_SAPPC|nr:hypothetical protein SPRG_22061 [Saprolegnia parasitica CBS 223.65]KDO34668.1 hypothetical protein SPRG_22061 [Saprolegnia parasitica CBS 223.65]|eukprot:XP_012194832.1 hypothetical protein SPRG_22061 [Saprolegnia parasitica CBS 223.65]